MARGRMLNTTIATDQRLNSLSIESEYLFLKSIPHLDRDGLIHGKANLLWAKVCPERMDLLSKIDELVDEWVAKSLVMKYDTQEGPILFFHGFTKNQSGFRYNREAPSQFDPPPGYVRTEGGLHFLTETPDGEPVNVWSDDELSTDNEQTDADLLRTYSGPTPDEVPPKAKQSKVKEGNSKDMPPIRLTGDPYLDAAARKQNNQDAGRPTFGRQIKIAEWNRDLSIGERLPIATALAEMTGKTALWDAGDERTHDELHQNAITAYRMGYTTAESITAHLDAWRADWRGKTGGTVGQLLEFLSTQKTQGKAKQSKKKVVYKPVEGDM